MSHQSSCSWETSDAGNVGNYSLLSTEPAARGASSGTEVSVALCEEPLDPGVPFVLLCLLPCSQPQFLLLLSSVLPLPILILCTWLTV